MHSASAWLALILASTAAAQEPLDVQQEEELTWDFSGTLLWSDPPGSEDRVTPILYADRGPLHLEARYNYEDLDTASFWAGWAFEGGTEVEASLTPMLGVVVGDTDGIAPGFELDLAWRRLAWYSEAEYLFDAEDSDDDYFYSWSTLTYGLTDWLSAGLVIERTKIVDTDVSVQRGLALEVTRGAFGFALYAYNLDDSDDSYLVLSLELAP